jgi:hypothetical protein
MWDCRRGQSKRPLNRNLGEPTRRLAETRQELTNWSYWWVMKDSNLRPAD